ncbi:MAG: ABC transporter substrate-binding protein [Stellaceae bacterium]
MRFSWLLLPFALLLAAPPARAEDSAEWQAVIAAAKQEGRVVFYTSAVGEPYHQEIGKAFEARYGIHLEALTARASELRERIRTEQAAGRVNGDLSFNGATTTKLQLDEGVFLPHGPLPDIGRLRPPFSDDGTRLPILVQAYGILVNTNLVKPGDEPKSWLDLADPKWRGRILSDDMRALGGGAVFFVATEERFGRAYHETLAQQQLAFSRDYRNDERRVARGEYAVLMPFVISDLPALKGLPVKLVVPEEGAPYIRFELCLLKGAPHPNAARLFMNFYLSEEAQLVYARSGFAMATEGLADKVPPEIRPLVEVKLLGTTDPARMYDMLALAKEIYK